MFEAVDVKTMKQQRNTLFVPLLFGAIPPSVNAGKTRTQKSGE
jgi:hypothetical protein